MLLPNMTFQELRNDLQRDLPEILERANKFFPQFRRMTIKQKKRNQNFAHFKKMTTQGKIKWEIHFFTIKGKKNARYASYGTYYHNKKGLRYICVDAVDGRLQIYNSHFFRRYNERMNFGLADDIRTINQTYLIRNTANAYALNPNKFQNGIRDVVAQIPDGLKFGTEFLKSGTVVWNTFISENEYKGMQGSLKDGILKFIKKNKHLEAIAAEDVNCELYHKKMQEKDCADISLRATPFQRT